MKPASEENDEAFQNLKEPYVFSEKQGLSDKAAKIDDQINNSFGNDEDPFNKIIPQKTEEDKDFNQFKEENEIIKFSPK